MKKQLLFVVALAATFLLLSVVGSRNACGSEITNPSIYNTDKCYFFVISSKGELVGNSSVGPSSHSTLYVFPNDSIDVMGMNVSAPSQFTIAANVTNLVDGFEFIYYYIPPPPEEPFIETAVGDEMKFTQLIFIVLVSYVVMAASVKFSVEVKKHVLGIRPSELLWFLVFVWTVINFLVFGLGWPSMALIMKVIHFCSWMGVYAVLFVSKLVFSIEVTLSTLWTIKTISEENEMTIDIKKYRFRSERGKRLEPNESFSDWIHKTPEKELVIEGAHTLFHTASGNEVILTSKDDEEVKPQERIRTKEIDLPDGDTDTIVSKEKYWDGGRVLIHPVPIHCENPLEFLSGVKTVAEMVTVNQRLVNETSHIRARISIEVKDKTEANFRRFANLKDLRFAAKKVKKKDE